MYRSGAQSVTSEIAAPFPSKAVYTGRWHPWIGVEVIAVAHPGHKGYHARVIDIRQDEKTISGLSVQIDYNTVSLNRQWLDCYILRCLE